jgi:hypothetical protein
VLQWRQCSEGGAPSGSGADALHAREGTVRRLGGTHGRRRCAEHGLSMSGLPRASRRHSSSAARCMGGRDGPRRVHKQAALQQLVGADDQLDGARQRWESRW